MTWHVTFSHDGLRFDTYPFPVASVARAPWLPASEIREVRLRRHPPEVVRTDGEVLFVPAADEPRLARFAQEAGIPCVERVDVWSWLNEPFLDTESGDDEQRNVLRLLAESGFDEAEVSAIRAQVGPAMLRYNAVAWEWIHLGHFDLLMALGFGGRLLRGPRRAPRDHERYRELSAVANRGRPTPAVGGERATEP